MRTNFKTALVSACVIAVLGAGVGLLRKQSNQRETASTTGLSRDGNHLVQPTSESAEAQLQAADAKPVALIEQESTAILKPPIISPENCEDLDAIREWARRNTDTALTWILTATGSNKRDAVVEVICAQLAPSDPVQSAALAEHFASGCSPLVENIVQQWAAQDAAGAYTYVANKTAGDTRNRLLSRVALAWAQKNPAAAAQLVSEEIPTGEIQSEAILCVLHQWVQRDPMSALAWVQAFPSGDLRNRVLPELESAVTYTANRE